MVKIKGATRAQLLSLPERDWQLTTSYDSLLILSDGTKHESGWGNITIIGCFDSEPFEIVTQGSDDIAFEVEASQLRMDCAMPSRAMHFWARGKMKFEVGCALSSITIRLAE